ncbi:MAG: hypothetical protein A2V93_11085 [Ignavibacteria bacterium RBG_16_34_14]|nr:MAG: hypothetical protein A2V93_11085 [Ignavibacteria bacterium RBG_16_34_14]
MSADLTSKTIHSLKWSYASTITNAVMQIGYTAVMARLLEPKTFGLVAMSGVILKFGSYFAQMGMGQALIQKKELFNDDIRAAFTSSLIMSVIFLMLTWFLAPYAVLIFDNTEVIPIIRVMSISFVLTGISTTSLALIRRNLKFKSLAVIEIISYIIGYAGIGVLFAVLGYGVWSLVFASLAQAFLSGLLSYFVTRHNLLPLFSWKKYKPLFSFGSRVSVISFFEFLGTNLDTLFIGRMLGAGKLGLYNRAFMVVNLPMQYFTFSISRVLFPSLSRIQNDKEKLKKIYLSSISVVGFILFSICFGISVTAEQIVMVILGEKWIAAVPVLQILALATPLNFISHFDGIICDATANLNKKLVLQTSYVIMLAGFFYFLGGFGLIGFAAGLVCASLLRNVGYYFITKRALGFNSKELFNSFYPSVISALFITLIIYINLILMQTFISSNLILLIGSVIIGSLSVVIFLFVKFNFRIREFLEERLLGNYKIYNSLKKVFSINTI